MRSLNRQTLILKRVQDDSVNELQIVLPGFKRDHIIPDRVAGQGHFVKIVESGAHHLEYNSILA
jgi:hypothetical protein